LIVYRDAAAFPANPGDAIHHMIVFADRISTIRLLGCNVVAFTTGERTMDRRSFVTSMLLSAGILAVTVGAASALPTAAPPDQLAPADNGNVEKVWWRRRVYRRHWRRWRRRW
jgi:hypothetical protein